MLKETIATGKDILEAQENARAALGAGPLDDEIGRASCRERVCLSV